MSPAIHHYCDETSIYESILTIKLVRLLLKEWNAFVRLDHITNWVIKEYQINTIIQSIQALICQCIHIILPMIHCSIENKQSCMFKN